MTVGSYAPGVVAVPSVTAGTIFDRTRTPLTVWFTACWLLATEPGATVIPTVGRLQRTSGLQKLGYVHNRRSQRVITY